MVTTTHLIRTINGKDLCEMVCVSTDTKPTEDIANGSLCLEMDTSDIYAFDGANNTWRKIS